jgi:DNA invertase Pin-like site-specific DNA recombinase
MIDDCKAGNIDMIITKSISRFARNTLDCLKYIRQLKDMNIPVLFEKESINTMDAKGEVLITIMASLAQQESQSLSQNVKMGLQYRYQQGKVQINHNRFLGYTKDADGNLVIDPEQAETVKRIYREYLEGLSMDKIAAGLERDGILTGAGGKKWHTSTINKILRNEKYIGDALLQKTYTTDFLNKTRVKNNGLVPQYYVEGDHEAIIPKDIYLQVQEELVRRRVVKTSANGKKRSYSCNHCFSQIVICGECGECGEMFRRLHWNNRGVKSIVWRCISRLESTGLECHARTINELLLQDVVVKAINQMLGDKSSYQAQLQLNIATVIRASQATAIDSIDEKLMALQQELIQKANSKEDYDEIADEIFRLRELRQKTTVDTAARDEQIKRINDLQDYISQQTTYLTEFDESLVRRWIKQITIWDDHITVELKSDVSIDVDA